MARGPLPRSQRNVPAPGFARAWPEIDPGSGRAAGPWGAALVAVTAVPVHFLGAFARWAVRGAGDAELDVQVAELGV